MKYSFQSNDCLDLKCGPVTHDYVPGASRRGMVKTRTPFSFPVVCYEAPSSAIHSSALSLSLDTFPPCSTSDPRKSTVPRRKQDSPSGMEGAINNCRCSGCCDAPAGGAEVEGWLQHDGIAGVGCTDE